MIFSAHIIAGATIGAKTHNLGVIIILGILSHLVMDKLPHWEYPVESHIDKFRETKSIKFLIPLILNSIIDVLFGLVIVFIAAWQENLLNPCNLAFIFAGIFFAILPDITMTTALIFGTERLKETYLRIHKKYLHCKKENEKEGTITFLGVSTEIVLVIISLLLFFS